VHYGAALMVMRVNEFDRITVALQDELHWLPVAHLIHIQIFMDCLNVDITVQLPIWLGYTRRCPY